jgi:flagellar hook-associated protein 1 FlgK
VPNVFGIGRGALKAFQTALGVTGHNIANVNTPGYSRQRVDFDTRQPEYVGVGFMGTGVKVGAISRIYDSFVVEQVRTNQSAFTQQQTYFELAKQIDNLLGDTATTLSVGLQSFFNSVHEVANDPTSPAARQVMLTEAQTLTSRFHQLNQSLEDSRTRLNRQLRNTVDEINSLSGSIASLNADISVALARGDSEPPNDLLDQRDALLEELSQQVAVTAVPQDDGTVSVFIGSGQSLIIGDQAFTLAASALGQDNDQLDIGITTSTGLVPITNLISGGRLAGLFEYRSQILDPAQNALGRIAAGISVAFNAQHRRGMDLDGDIGRDFFTSPQATVLPDADNSGPGPVTVNFNDISKLTTEDYRLSYAGGAWTLRRVSDGQVVPFDSGSGTSIDPYIVDGISIVTDPAAVADDVYLIQPTRDGAAQIGVAIDDNRHIAAAGAVQADTVPSNTGDGQISAAQVLDSSDPDLLKPVDIVFDDPPISFQIVGSGLGSIAYTEGANIDYSGWRVQISGNPQAGDTFTVTPNYGGVGDNGNALQLAALQQSLIMAEGTASLDNAYTMLMADVGTKTRQAEINADAQQRLLEQSQADRESVSGVNLDEEAANLMQFQQAYQAAAQVIAVADSMFEILMNAVRR